MEQEQNGLVCKFVKNISKIFDKYVMKRSKNRFDINLNLILLLFFIIY